MAYKEKAQGSGPVGITETFRPDYRIAWLSGLGFLGLIFGFIAMAYLDFLQKDNERASIFHEVGYHPRVIAGQAIRFLSDSLRGAIALNGQRLVVNTALVKRGSGQNADALAVATDSVAFLKTQIVADNATKQSLDVYRRYYEDASLNDSLSFTKLNGMLHFNISPDTIVKWDSAFVSKPGYSWSVPVKYWVKINTQNGVLIHSGDTVLHIDRYASNIQFMARYPGAGTWVFMIAIFCSFCLIAISTSIIVKGQVFRYFKSKEIASPSKWAFYFAWFFIFVALIILRKVASRSFDDEVPIKALFFMKGFETSMFWVNLLGFITGAGCLAGFIRSASMLGYFANSIKDKTKAIVQQRVVVAAVIKSNPGQTNPDGQVQLDEMVAAKARSREIYNRLQSYFNTYFMLSAVILSLMVLCTGALFNTVNSLDFVRLLSANWGYSPAGTDIVYLYGGVYTVILLLIYLPARLRFNEIQLELPPPERPADGSSAPAIKTNWLDMISDPLGRMKGVLLAASPLLAGLLQSLFDLLFKH